MDVLLIGTGGVGTVIARHIAKSDVTDSVVLADIDYAQASRVSKRLGKKASPLRLDASDLRKVEKAAKGKQLVINASLPRFNSNIMEAAYAVGANYIDLALEDSRAPYRLASKWRKKGLTAVVGLGEDPGISNIAARLLSEDMVSVDSVKIRDGETAESSKYPFICLFSPETFIKETMEEPVIFSEGKLRKIPRLSDKEMYDFPEGIGPLPVYSVNHEEVYTLPESIGKGVSYVDFKLALTDDTLKYLEVLNSMGFMSEKDIEVRGKKIRPIDLTLKLIPQPASLGKGIRGKAIVLVEVSGKTDDRKAERTLYAAMPHESAYEKYGVTATSFLTGSGAAAGAIQLLEGGNVPAGVVPPEALDPFRYFEILEKLGVMYQKQEN
ncbi:MAG: saccharopine dehydrogenase C-terminal domain-containing protein [Methanomassiliicoccales archaeon]